MNATFKALEMVSLVSIVEAGGLYFLRAGGVYNTIIASCMYGYGVVPLLSLSLKYEGIAIVNLLWNIISTVFGFIIGIYFFKEKIHYRQYIGAALSLFGIGLILMTPKE